MDTIEAADRSDTIITMTKERMKERQTMALDLKKQALEAKLKRLEGAKFADSAAKAEAIARCKAGLDELQQALAAAK
jgi:hypothetical protein